MTTLPYQLFFIARDGSRCSRFYTDIPRQTYVGVAGILVDRERNIVVKTYLNCSVVLEDWKAGKEFALREEYYDTKINNFIRLDEFRFLVASALSEEPPSIIANCADKKKL